MPNYFRYVPKFEYVTRDEKEQVISEYKPVKNLFSRAKLRNDIFNDLSYFTKYQIVGEDRPDNVANKVYGDESLDWVVLLANNILNIYEEWPLTNDAFNEYLTNKYGTQDNIFGVHHYESVEVKDTSGNIIVPQGLEVPQNYSIEFYDEVTELMDKRVNIATAVTNYDYELKKENEKRNIYVLKREYLNVVLNDMEETLEYKKGSTQYVSRTMKKADNIRLFE
jgi:hypothetical protein|tara:strand:- start:1733 stop:2401 length:669 start_codon:yes stop_codon:yes gene_type:complete